MKPWPCLCLCFCLLAWLDRPLRAADPPAWRVGDVADADIVTPVTLDVLDPAATAALQSARATQYPAVFRSFPGVTNGMTRDFLAAFALARTKFLAEVTGEFHSPKLGQANAPSPAPTAKSAKSSAAEDQPLASPQPSAGESTRFLPEATIASYDFGRRVTAFDMENRNFPITDELAAEWARGGDGRAIRENVLASLLRAASRRVRPDALPKGMVVGETIRLVPVTEADEKLSVATVQQSQLVPLASLTTLSEAQALFRGEFPAGQQLFARALAAWLKPNCLPDGPFTQLTRGTAVCQVIVSDHYDPGDAIVRQGDKIDAKTLAALAALREKMKSSPPEPPAPLATSNRLLTSAPATPAPPPAGAPVSGPARSMSASPAPAKAPDLLALAPAMPDRILTPAPTKPEPTPHARLRHEGLIMTLAGASAVALLVAFWQWLKPNPRRTLTPPPDRSVAQADQPLAPAAQAPLPFPDANQSDLAPQVTQAVREAVQQELASQRRELLLAQQAATDEIAALVQRLDELQVPMQERLHTYETRILVLEKELALRNEENRQLLKMKIEMVSRQLETERAATLVPPLAVENH